VVTIFSACDKSEQKPYQPSYGVTSVRITTRYVIGVHPLHNPKRLHEVFSPVADILTNKIDGSAFEIEASRNYNAFDKKLYSGKFEFALPNPYQTILSLNHNYRVFGKMGDDENFRGIILVRKDSNIKEISDLKGKVVCFPAPTALAATMMPQYYLFEHGIDVNRDIKTIYVGSQESSIMNVFLGNADACATWPPPWQALSKERPQLFEELVVKWKTEPLLNNGLVVRGDVAPDLVNQVSNILFELHNSKEGRIILERMKLTRFEPASNDTYEPVKKFLEEFNSKVRHIIR